MRLQNSPDGYRLPTKDEFQALINGSTVSRGGGWSSSDYGYIKFTSGSNSVEFPAVGLRTSSVGSLNVPGSEGDYWSSVTGTSGSNNAYRLTFSDGNLGVGSSGKQYGLSVRCVR